MSENPHPMRRCDKIMARIVELATADLVTAGQLAKDLDCNERTIYRYITRLRNKGVRIQGEVGYGYRIFPEKKVRFNLGLEVSTMILEHFPGVEQADPHAVAAVADGLGEAFAGVLSIVAVRRGTEAVELVIERQTDVIETNMRQMIAKAMLEYDEKPEGAKGEQ